MSRMSVEDAMKVLREVDITVQKYDFSTELVISEHDGPGQFRVHHHSNADALREVFFAIEALSQSEDDGPVSCIKGCTFDHHGFSHMQSCPNAPDAGDGEQESNP